jgi:hypothetical protein
MGWYRLLGGQLDLWLQDWRRYLEAPAGTRVVPPRSWAVVVIEDDSSENLVLPSITSDCHPTAINAARWLVNWRRCWLADSYLSDAPAMVEV